MPDRPAGTSSTTTSARGALAAAGEASGDFLLAALFLLTWISPGASLALPLSAALLTMLLEFFVVHSSSFMGSVALAEGPRAERAKKVLGLGTFYTLFVGGFALGFQTWWPVIAFWTLTLNRSLGILFDPHPGVAQRLRIRKSWAAITMSYLAAVTVTTLLPMPQFGIDRAVAAAANLPGSGLWIGQPHRVVAAGALHFGLCGVSALLGYRWISDASIPGEPRRFRRPRDPG